VTLHEPGRVVVRTRDASPGLLLLSEAHYPAWRAYVDGRPAEVYVADHMFLAVPTPAGEHTVELRYESGTLKAGVAISLATSGALGVLWVLGATTGSRRRQRQPRPPYLVARSRASRPGGIPERERESGPGR
jgi:hypothetical protein